MSENRQSVVCVRSKSLDEKICPHVPGSFCWDFDFPELGGKRDDETHFLYLMLPGEQHRGAIRVRRGAPGGDRVWGWDGNEEQPTLQPSIYHVGVWHGFLERGFLRSC